MATEIAFIPEILSILWTEGYTITLSTAHPLTSTIQASLIIKGCMSTIEAVLLINSLLVVPTSKEQLKRLFPALTSSQIQIIWDSLR